MVSSLRSCIPSQTGCLSNKSRNKFHAHVRMLQNGTLLYYNHIQLHINRAVRLKGAKRKKGNVVSFSSYAKIALTRRWS